MLFKILLNHVKFQLSTSVFTVQGFYIHELGTAASSEQHNFGLIRHRNIKKFHMKSKFSFCFNNIIAQQLISATKAWH